jgi:hypothetical protein
LRYAQGLLTNNTSKILTTAVEYATGYGASRLALRVTGFAEVSYAWKANVFRSVETGRFVKNILGVEALRVGGAAELGVTGAFKIVEDTYMCTDENYIH